MNFGTAVKICGGLAIFSLFLFVLAFAIGVITAIKAKQLTYRLFRWSFEGWGAFV